MRKGMLLAGATLGFAVSLLTSAASAAVLYVSYEGTVVDGHDDTGEFNLAGQSLDGLSFTANYVIDLGTAGATHDSYPWTDFYYGTFASSPVTATITLNGVTRSFGQYSGYDQRTDYSLQPGCVTDCTDASFLMGASNQSLYDIGLDRYVTKEYMNMGGFSSDGTIHGIDHGPVNFTNPPVTLQGYVSINQYVQHLPGNGMDDIHNAVAILKINSVMTTMEAVPEPSSWALMISGFGMAGAAMRASRRRLARAA